MNKYTIHAIARKAGTAGDYARVSLEVERPHGLSAATAAELITAAGYDLHHVDLIEPHARPALVIEPRKAYLRGDGRRVLIMGTTGERPDWYWSLCGDWYTQHGEFVNSVRAPIYSGLYITRFISPDSHLNLGAEVPYDISGVKFPEPRK